MELTQVDKKDQVRLQAEASLQSFINLIHKGRVLGSLHINLINWWTRLDAKSHQLVLLPRDHQKSALLAYRVAWEITKNPAVRILYVSSTANLATKQLKFIKDILTSDIYRFYWPEMVNDDEGKREKWTESEISVDHPKRKAEYIRDPTVFTAGLTTNIAGLHCDKAALDDIVVQGNAYTEDGREKTAQLYSLLASIEGANAEEWVVGTRYHPKDLYNNLVSMTVDMYDENGNQTSDDPLYEVFERQVESNGDGTGEYLWPLQKRYDGKEFGFDQSILAKKRSQYIDKVQFRAQYYNDPNDPEGAGITRDVFQYYDRSHLNRKDGKWFFRDTRMNIFAAVDFAFSLKKGADYTAIVIVGIDNKNNYYVLDIARFKTDKISEYFSQILLLYKKWDFRKLRAEVTGGQDVIVKDLKANYIREHGLALSVDEYRPTRNEGNKKERVRDTLMPKYDNKQIWHYQGGNCQILEEELLMSNPSHDDVKDALASCINVCVPPSRMFGSSPIGSLKRAVNSRFGGI